MKCEKCGNDYPSEYYFKTDTVCVECYKKLTSEDQQQAVRHSLMKYPMTSSRV